MQQQSPHPPPETPLWYERLLAWLSGLFVAASTIVFSSRFLAYLAIGLGTAIMTHWASTYISTSRFDRNIICLFNCGNTTMYSHHDTAVALTTQPPIIVVQTVPVIAATTIVLTRTAVVSPTVVVPTPASIATPTPASTSRLEVTLPDYLVVEEDSVVTLEISADPYLTQREVFSVEVGHIDGSRSRIEDRIHSYPVMSAELLGANFDIQQSNAGIQRVITSTQTAAWMWHISAKQPGKHIITLNIYTEEIVDGERRIFLVKSETRNIMVIQRPFLTRVLDWFSQNLATIMSASGPLSLLLAYLAYRQTRSGKKGQEKAGVPESTTRTSESPSEDKRRNGKRRTKSNRFNSVTHEASKSKRKGS